MINRTSIIVSISVLTLIGVGLFNVSQNVRDYESTLKNLNKKITHEQDTINTLQAEWYFLNQPARLEKLAKKHTDLAPMGGQDLMAISAVPLIEESPQEADGNIEVTKENTSKRINPYISKTKVKSRRSKTTSTLPVHQISLRDIWGKAHE